LLDEKGLYGHLEFYHCHCGTYHYPGKVFPTRFIETEIPAGRGIPKHSNWVVFLVISEKEDHTYHD